MNLRFAIREYWEGRAPLWKAFWILGLLIPICLGIALIVILSLAEADPENKSILVALSVFNIPFYVFISISLWRCAKNSHLIWVVLAKIWAALTLIAAALEFISLIFRVIG